MSRTPRRKADVLVATALGVVVGLTWLPRIQGPLDLRYDAGVHYVLGASIAQGKGYRLLNEPGEIEAIQYPPGFPLLIAAHQLVAGTGDPLVVGRWLRLTLALCSLGYVLLAYLFLRRHLPLGQAALGGLLCATSPLLVILSDGAIPDIPFAMLVTLFALCVPRPTRPARWLAGTLAVAGFLLRTAGVALLAAWVFESFARRDMRGTAFRAAVAMACLLAWHGYIARVESSPAYGRPTYPYQRAEYLYHNVSYAANIALRQPFLPELGRATAFEHAGRIARALPLLPGALGQAATAPKDGWRSLQARLQRALGLGRFLPATAVEAMLALLGAVIMGGLIMEAAQGPRVLVACCVGTVMVVLATPWTNHWARYLMAVAPLLVLAGFRSGHALSSLVNRRIPPVAASARWFVEVVACLLVVVNLLALADLYRYGHQIVAYQGHLGQPVVYRLFRYQDRFRAFDAGLDWLRHHARPSDIVASTMPHWVYLRTGLLSVMPPADTGPQTALSLLDAVPVTYVMAGGSTAVVWARAHAFPAVRGASDRWEAVYSDRDGSLVIYRRRP